MEAFIGRFVVFPRCEIHDGLRETGPQVNVVVGPYDSRQSESWKLELKARGSQTGLLHGFGQIASEVGEESAACPARFAVRLTPGLGEPYRPQIVLKAAADGVSQRQLSGKRHVGNTRRTSRVSPLNLNRGIECVDRARYARSG